VGRDRSESGSGRWVVNNNLYPCFFAVTLLVEDYHAERVESIVQRPRSPACQESVVYRLGARASHHAPADGIWTYPILDHEVREIGHIGGAPDVDPSLKVLIRGRMSKFDHCSMCVELTVVKRGLQDSRSLGPAVRLLWIYIEEPFFD
jgi:hypothetical protein